MRKLFVLVAMAIAAAAVMAAPAAAVSSHPDFPHGDDNPDHWKSVSVLDAGGELCDPVCEFDAGGSWDFVDGSWPVSCTGSLGGSIGSDAAVELSYGVVTGMACPFSASEHIPWRLDVCAYDNGIGDPEYWGLLSATFQGSGGVFHFGSAYGQFTGDLDGGVLAVDGWESQGDFFWDFGSGEVDQEADFDVASIGMESGEGSCAAAPDFIL